MFFIGIFLPIVILLTLGKKIIFSLLLIASLPLTYNIFHEVINYGPNKLIYIPFLGLIIQSFWVLGFLKLCFFINPIKKENQTFEIN